MVVVVVVDYLQICSSWGSRQGCFSWKHSIASSFAVCCVSVRGKCVAIKKKRKPTFHTGFDLETRLCGGNSKLDILELRSESF